jgi:hypothetical protein
LLSCVSVHITVLLPAKKVAKKRVKVKGLAKKMALR